MRIARLIFCLFLAVGMLAIPVPSRAQVAVGISVRIGPPVLPVYVQPVCPGPGFIWVPGYWAYGDDDYFWVPGTWVEPPEVGFLWTPGYWGWEEGFYIWHAGYWGPHVGYYGGINYGFGYSGVGFFGGEWRGGAFFYNRAVTNVNVTVIRNTYNTTVINNNTTVNRVSFNGGPGGTTARPTSAEMAAAHERHVEMTSEQMQHRQAASADRTLRASVNHGRPDVAATPRAGQFSGPGAETTNRPINPNRPPDRSNEIDRRGNSRDNNPRISDRPDRPPSSRSSNNAPVNPRENSGRSSSDRPPSMQPSGNGHVNPALEQKHQREQDKMRQQQDAERQKMERKQTQQRQKMDQQRANAQQQQQLQQRHQQQTDQLQRKHDQQTQRLQERQQREAQKQNNRPPKPGRPPVL
jgi:WXXGXW repeat (2 copies)